VREKNRRQREKNAATGKRVLDEVRIVVKRIVDFDDKLIGCTSSFDSFSP
jgi:hypothetical protein